MKETRYFETETVVVESDWQGERAISLLLDLLDRLLSPHGERRKEDEQ